MEFKVICKGLDQNPVEVFEKNIELIQPMLYHVYNAQEDFCCC